MHPQASETPNLARIVISPDNALPTSGESAVLAYNLERGFELRKIFAPGLNFNEAAPALGVGRDEVGDADPGDFTFRKREVLKFSGLLNID